MPPTTTLPRPTLIVRPSPLKIGIPPSEECKTEKLYLTWTGPETVTVTIYPTRELSKNLKIPSRVFVPPDRTATLPVNGCLSKKLVGLSGTVKFYVMQYPEQVDVQVILRHAKEVAVCGNGVCERGENWWSCPEDCPLPRWILLLLVIPIAYLLWPKREFKSTF